MIKLYGKTHTKQEVEVPFEITRFPDGTSQVWRIEMSESIFSVEVEWTFENEAELINVLQLGQLLKTVFVNGSLALSVPFLPYGRQDKNVGNQMTFGLYTFVDALTKTYDVIKTVDAHNPKATSKVQNIIPNDRIATLIKQTSPDYVCFPDKGATTRGYEINNIMSFFLDKKRNQDTGDIEGLTCNFNVELEGKNVLILDDICDGGRTFIEAAKLLKNKGASKVYLYTTHGIYSKGTQVLFDSGIDRVFNYTKEIANANL